MNKPTTSFVAACKDFFGFLPGQGLKEFADEIKRVPQKDKEELTGMLREAGYNIA